jgi:hypothetical protein
MHVSLELGLLDIVSNLKRGSICQTPGRVPVHRLRYLYFPICARIHTLLKSRIPFYGTNKMENEKMTPSTVDQNVAIYYTGRRAGTRKNMSKMQNMYLRRYLARHAFKNKPYFNGFRARLVFFTSLATFQLPFQS